MTFIEFGTNFITFLLIIYFFRFLYCYSTRNFNYWKKRGIPGPTPLPFAGNTLSSFIEAISQIDVKWYKEYGRIYGIYHKQTPILTVAEPDLIRDILVKDFQMFTDHKEKHVDHDILKYHLIYSTGDDWKRRRAIISPTFTPSKIKKMYPMVMKCLYKLLDQLNIHADKKGVIDLKDMHGKYTIDVIARCAFATKINSHKDPNNPFIVNAKKIFEVTLKRALTILLMPKLILKLLNIKSRVDESANEFFLNLTKYILRQRKSNPNPQKFDDFIQLLVEAEDNIEDSYNIDNLEHLNNAMSVKKQKPEMGKIQQKLSEEEIMAQGWLFFAAGYETTSTTLTFCLYELALHQDIQGRLYDEVQSALKQHGDFNYEILNNLPYLDAVISETLRFYPPLLRLDRRATSDYILENTGIKLLKGQVVEIPVYAIHHSEEFYPNPERFDPDRFLPENKQNIDPYTYLPFGIGPRNCLGMRFALMEAKMCLANVLLRYRYFKTDKTSVPLQFMNITPLCHAKNVLVGIEIR